MFFWKISSESQTISLATKILETVFLVEIYIFIMDAIKVEEEDEEVYLSGCDNSCLICLELVDRKNQGQLKSLNCLLTYLKIGDKIKFAVCDKCALNVIKFEKLCSVLEKVRLEMDYLLGLFQSALLKSKKEDLNSVSYDLERVRKSVMSRCEEKILNPKLEIRLQRVDPSSLSKLQSQPVASNCSEGWSPNEDDNEDCDTDSLQDNSNHLLDSSPVISEIKNVKTEVNLEDAVTKKDRKGKRAYLYTPANCPKCSKTFSNKYELKRHNNAIHLGLKPFKCPECSKSFSRHQQLREHTNSVHLRLYKCDKCDKTFANPKSLRLHRLTPHKLKNPNSKSFPCGKCDKSFGTLRWLKMHEKSVHTEAKYQCPVCEKFHKTQHGLKEHVSSVHDKQRYHCQAPGCDKSYSNPTSLRNHHRLEHPDFTVPPKPKTPAGQDYSDRFTVVTENEENVMECKLCSKRLKTLPLIRAHIRQVHGQKEHTCEICGYSITTKGKLTEHIKRMHKTDNLVECKLCKKQFKSMNLGHHMRNFHGPKKLVCEMCGYATVNKQNLDFHIERMHSIKKKVECHLCKRKFNSTYISKHIRRKHGELKFKCQDCKFASNFKYDLDIHVRNIHKDRTPK